MKKLESLVGKTVSEVFRDVYGAGITISFEDGTKLKLSAGQDSAHNDRWSTVEYEIK